jgi:hypothetical protein
MLYSFYGISLDNSELRIFVLNIFIFSNIGKGYYQISSIIGYEAVLFLPEVSNLIKDYGLFT